MNGPTTSTRTPPPTDLKGLVAQVVRDFGPVVCVASCHAYEDRTPLLERMGHLLAEQGTPTLLVDADHIEPDLHTHFDVEAAPGLDQILGASVDRRFLPIHEVEVGLWVLTSGRKSAGGAAFGTMPGIMRAVRELAPERGAILVATPPLLSDLTGATVCSVADAAVLIVRKGITGKAELARASRLIEASGTPLAAVVIAQ